VTKDWLLQALPLAKIVDKAEPKIEKLALFAAERRASEDEEPVGEPSVLNTDIVLDNFYLHQTEPSTLVVEAIYGGECEAEIEYHQYRRRRWRDYDELDFGDHDRRDRFRLVRFECALIVELVIKEKELQSWSIEEVTDCV
jgi:hypothetical protein